MISKSNGLSLETHSNIVSKTALQILSNISKDEQCYDRFENIVRHSSLLHDIGKLTVNFQKFLSGKLKKPGLKYRHNEIGWAFLSKYITDDFSEREFILNIVYWHHGISNQLAKDTDTDILSSLDDESIDNMLKYLKQVIGDENINKELEYVDSIFAPLFYPNDGVFKQSLPKLQLCRSSVITADRISSDLSELSEVNDYIISDYFDLKSVVEITETKFDGTERFECQKNIINKEHNGTTLIKAPAGFGKTIMGIMWSFKYNKKVMWVVPRNTIAKSLYISILEEFKNLNINPSIQLIISGCIENTNDDSLGMYEADVIVTNIDNFLAPDFKNEIMDSSSLLFGSTIIFDEYHELISKAPLMSLFVNVMRTRHRLTNSKTLLLTGTPIPCEFLWETLNNKTTILPNSDNHYPAVHDDKYLINVTTKKQIVTPNSNTLVIKNTIGYAQDEKVDGDYSLLLHSDFTDEKKESDFLKLIEGYNKKSEISSVKPNVLGTHIIQASIDISFDNLVEDVLSPESTIQRTGRCNRFGNSEVQSEITILKEVSGESYDRKLLSESSIKEILYDKKLSDAWFDFMLKYDSKHLTLDNLYVIYNDFNKSYSKEIKQYIRKRFDESVKHLSKIYPYKFDNKKKKSDVLTAGSNKLRSVNDEVFYIVEHENGKDWIGPFTRQVMKGFDIEFNESSNIQNRMLKTMKSIRDSNDNRFEFSNIIDKKKYTTIDGIRRMSKKSNTPYIVYDRYYNDELGIIKR